LCFLKCVEGTFFIFGSPSKSDYLSPRKNFQRPWDSSPSPYTKKVSVLEAQKNHMETLDNKKVLFAGNEDRWQAMLSIIQDGDELWEYTSPAEMWEMLAGREGIVLVRDGKVIDDLLLVMN